MSKKKLKKRIKRLEAVITEVIESIEITDHNVMQLILAIRGGHERSEVRH